MTVDEIPDAGWSVGSVARRLGVAPATLRTWDRRYGLGPSGHAAGAHRRYSEGDLARLEQMRRLVISGIAPADAARVVLSDGPQLVPPSAGRAGGGNVIPLPGGDPASRGLARAAKVLDVDGMADIIDAGLRDRGVVETWDNLVVPVLVAVGRQWDTSGKGIDVEHALSAVAHSCLSGYLRQAPPTVDARAVLLACVPNDEHSLPLWATAAALAERQVAVRVLGARLPREALADAVRRLSPAVVFLWSQTTATADLTLIDEIPSRRPAVRAMVGGPGWPAQVPAGVAKPRDLADAVAQITFALGR